MKKVLLSVTFMLSFTAYDCEENISERKAVLKDIKASSFVKNNYRRFHIMNFLVFAPRDPWMESRPGDGIGENITFFLEDVAEIRDLEIENGHSTQYYKYNRVKDLKITTDTGQSTTIRLKNTRQRQRIRLPKRFFGKAIKFTIMSVYRGSSHTTAIQNINFDYHIGKSIAPKLAEHVNVLSKYFEILRVADKIRRRKLREAARNAKKNN